MKPRYLAQIGFPNQIFTFFFFFNERDRYIEILVDIG